MSQPILSICIPTYNRAEYLARTLDSIIAQPRFQSTGDVEVIISDNCSTDDTQNVVNKYIEQYGNKIRYFRNNENIYDKNLELAMARGQGVFLKAHNDTLIVRDGTLDKMCSFIEKYIKTKHIIFFLNKANSNTVHEFNNANDFISHISIDISNSSCLYSRSQVV